MEIPSIHSTQLYSQAARKRRPGVKFSETKPQESARDSVQISDKAQKRWKALDTLNSLLDLRHQEAPILSLHSAEAVGKMLQTLASRGIVGFETGHVGHETGTRYAATVVGLTS